jgi:hypothetical protein
VSSVEDKPREEPNQASSDQAVNESVAMLSSYFDLAQKSSSRLSPAGDEPVPSMFREAVAIPHGRRGSSNGKASKLLLAVIGSFLFFATGGAILSFLIFSSDKEVVASAARPAFPRTAGAEASLSSAAPDAVEAPQSQPAAPTQQTQVEGKPWSETMEAYKKLLAQQDSSDASASRQNPDDPVLEQYESWLKAKP